MVQILFPKYPPDGVAFPSESHKMRILSTRDIYHLCRLNWLLRRHLIAKKTKQISKQTKQPHKNQNLLLFSHKIYKNNTKCNSTSIISPQYALLVVNPQHFSFF